MKKNLLKNYTLKALLCLSIAIGVNAVLHVRDNRGLHNYSIMLASASVQEVNHVQ